MLYIGLDILFKILGYSFFLYGLWRLIGEPFLTVYLKSGFRNMKRRRIVKRVHELNNVEDEKQQKSKLYNHLDLTLSSLSKNGEGNVFNFVLLVAIIFIVSDITLFFSLKDLVVSSLFGFMFSLFPYAVIRFRLTNMRLKTSLAFLNEFHIIIQNYQSTDKDLYYTILYTAKEIKARTMKRVFMNLFSVLQNDRSSVAFKKGVKKFTYSINSSFVKRFGKLLEKAHDDFDISVALYELGQDMSKRKKDLSKDKTQKFETVMMGYVPVFLLPLFVFMGYKISGVVNFWYIFTQRIPLIVFTICVILSIISFMLAFILSKPRADI